MSNNNLHKLYTHEVVSIAGYILCDVIAMQLRILNKEEKQDAC